MQRLTGSTTTASRGSTITMTNQQQTDSIVSYRKQLDAIFKGFVYLGKNFKMVNGKIELADTIYTNMIITKKNLTIGIDTTGTGSGIDTLIVNPPHQ